MVTKVQNIYVKIVNHSQVTQARARSTRVSTQNANTVNILAKA